MSILKTFEARLIEFNKKPVSKYLELIEYVNWKHVFVINIEYDELFKTTWSKINENKIPTIRIAIDKNSFSKKIFKKTE